MGSSLDSVETVGFPFVDFDLSPLVQAGRFDFNQISFLSGVETVTGVLNHPTLARNPEKSGNSNRTQKKYLK